ncbi:hypothetical protein V1264_003341 [Littorina saxatilis]|uniref:Uncharacterized protein n=1 Tax=Littorina saxatilis TaxID=31220 RepID=A0AAN9B5T7_9CAEN
MHLHPRLSTQTGVPPKRPAPPCHQGSRLSPSVPYLWTPRQGLKSWQIGMCGLWTSGEKELILDLRQVCHSPCQANFPCHRCWYSQGRRCPRGHQHCQVLVVDILHLHLSCSCVCAAQLQPSAPLLLSSHRYEPPSSCQPWPLSSHQLGSHHDPSLWTSPSLA